MVKKLSLMLATVLVIVTGGCAKRTIYKPNPIKSLKEQKCDFQETKKEVTIRAKRFTADDCKEIFQDRADRLNNITPIQISFENNGDKVWHLLDKNISLTLEQSQKIIGLLSTNGYRFLALGALIFGAGSLLAIVGAISLFGLILPYTYVGISATPAYIKALASLAFASTILGCLMVIPGTPATMIITAMSDNKNNNAELSGYLKETALGKAIVIAPRKTIDLLIFVRNKNYKENFEIKLLNDDLTDNLPFSMHLPPLHSNVE
jgi:hypothetical protein